MTVSVQADTQAALAFLRKWCPSGPWVLTAIDPEKVAAPETVSYGPQSWAACVKWIDQRQWTRNLYFMVNPPRGPLASKAAKTDVARMAWIHVDVDPEKGRDIEESRADTLAKLTSFEPKPTVVIDSGGGYQAFWRLEEDPSLWVEGGLQQIETLELYNLQVARVLGGDHCHNIDRIMRLPGTVNLPDEKKRKRGRVPALAKLEWFNPTSYSISKFDKAVPVQAASGKPRTKLASGNIPPMDVESLREWCSAHNKNVSDYTCAIIATGQDPMDPGKYPSRSEALFRVCCDLVRAGIPDEVIVAVISGPNEIASSVREQRDWESYALRQIDRAKDEAIDPMLRELNERHAVISDIGGKCRIISEVWDPSLKRMRVSKQSFEDFRNRYRHRRVTVGQDKKGAPIMMPAGHWWIDNPQRRQYDAMVFAPGDEPGESNGCYNLWQGFGCEALPGTKHLSLISHIRNNVCAGDERNFKYLMGWLARTVQHPDSPGETAIVIKGRRGTGKSFVAKAVGRLFGRHFLQVSDSKHLVGSFNAHLRDAIFVFGDEAFFAGDKRHESVLKTLITEEYLIIEGKGIDAELGSNFTHLMLASNEDWVVPAGLDERRFLVLECADTRAQDHLYFQSIQNDLDNGGYENLLWELLHYDLTEFVVQHPPTTKGLQEQKVLSMSPENQWMLERIMEGRLVRSQDQWQREAIKHEVYGDYINEMKDRGLNFRLSPISFGKFLAKALPSLETTQKLVKVPWTNEHGMDVMIDKRAYVLKLPKLEDVRRHWDTHFGGPYCWPQACPNPENPQEPIAF